MSDPSTNEPEAQSPPELREHAKRQEAAAVEARAEADALRAQNRSLTFQAAGVAADTPLGALFDKAYDGDLTVDAVKTAWSELAPQGAAPAAEVNDGPTPEELASAQARQALTQGGTPPGEEPTPDVWPAAIAGFKEDRANGVRVERAQQNAFQKVIDAAAAGDERVLFDENAWKAQFDR